jgi:predicted nuclease of predicted toxin-antitoxin system
MLFLLLDENISPEITKQITEKRPDISIISVYHWHEGDYKGKSDENILATAQQENLTLVTYDQKTILPVLVQWGQLERDHAGVVFLDERSIANNNFGAQVRSLIALWDAHHADDWLNRVDFLRPAAV